MVIYDNNLSNLATNREHFCVTASQKICCLSVSYHCKLNTFWGFGLLPGKISSFKTLGFGNL